MARWLIPFSLDQRPRRPLTVHAFHTLRKVGRSPSAAANLSVEHGPVRALEDRCITQTHEGAPAHLDLSSSTSAFDPGAQIVSTLSTDTMVSISCMQRCWY